MKIRIDLLKIMRKIRHKGRREQVFISKRTYDRQKDKKKWERPPTLWRNFAKEIKAK